MNPEDMAKDCEDTAKHLLDAAKAIREGDGQAAGKALGLALPFMAMQATTALEAGLPVGYYLTTDDGKEAWIDYAGVKREKVQ